MPVGNCNGEVCLGEGVTEVALYVKGGLKRSLSIGNFIGIYAYARDIRIKLDANDRAGIYPE